MVFIDLWLDSNTISSFKKIILNVFLNNKTKSNLKFKIYSCQKKNK